MTSMDSVYTIVGKLAEVVAHQKAPTNVGEWTIFGTTQIILIAVIVGMGILLWRTLNLIFKAIAPIQEVIANQKIQDNKITVLSDDFREHKSEDKAFHEKINERAEKIQVEVHSLRK